ncbi:MAG: LD-carboxypeptidase [Flavobacteriales bacterium]
MTPPFLKSGDTIGIVATARWIDEDALKPAIGLFESWGLQVVVASNVHSRHFQLAGNDTFRIQNLQEMMDREDVRAIVVARGGYGTVRLIDQLNFDGICKYPKWICGFSDVTVLHNALNNLGIATIHGPMPFTFAENTLESVESLRRCLFGEQEVIHLPGTSMPQTIEATSVVGGNLSVIASQLGSSTQIKTQGKLLFLEDIDEMTYHIDRMLIALKRAAIFDNCVGILAGGFSGMRDNTKDFGFSNDNPWGQLPIAMLRDIAQELNLPLIEGFPAGHIADNRAFYLGRTCELTGGSSSSAEIRYS